MPAGDGTGPMGTGPIGRGMGSCGRGLRRGFGRGPGWRRLGFFPAGYEVEMTKEQKIKVLEAEQKELQAELDEVKKAIEKEKHA